VVILRLLPSLALFANISFPGRANPELVYASIRGYLRMGVIVGGVWLAEARHSGVAVIWNGSVGHDEY
jgi:hypothetical protein